MKRTPIIEDIPQGNSAHPDARKPLSAFRTITAVCDLCGHTKTLDQEALDAMPAVLTFGDLWRHAFCAPCREAGIKRDRASLMLYGVPLESKAQPSVKWSEAKVFTDDRADPTPHLPRRNIFDRRVPSLERMKP